ncbi:MAG: flavodoxin family protein [Vibrio toranzoniae]
MKEHNYPVNSVVVYHSGYGHTKRMAEAVAEGARATLISIDQDGEINKEDWEALNNADAIIFGSPTYMGGPSWQFKKFADSSSKAWFEGRWQNKIFGGFTTSASINGDKLNTLNYFVLLGAQHGGIWVSMDIKPANLKTSDRNDPNWLGSYIAPMGQTPADAPVEEMLIGDLETASRYAARVVSVASRLRQSNSI